MCRTVEMMFRNFANAKQVEDRAWEAVCPLFTKVIGKGKTEEEARENLRVLLKPVADQL